MIKTYELLAIISDSSTSLETTKRIVDSCLSLSEIKRYETLVLRLPIGFQNINYSQSPIGQLNLPHFKITWPLSCGSLIFQISNVATNFHKSQGRTSYRIGLLSNYARIPSIQVLISMKLVEFME